MTNLQWVLIVAAAVLYLLTCLRVAMSFRRIGRSPILWFLITLFFTAIPPAIYMSYLRLRTPARRPRPAERVKAGPAGVRRCPHCGKIIPRDRAPGPDGIFTCPDCKQAIHEDQLA